MLMLSNSPTSHVYKARSRTSQAAQAKANGPGRYESGGGAQAAATAANDIDLRALSAKAAEAARAEAAWFGEGVKAMDAAATVQVDPEEENLHCEQRPCEMIDAAGA